MQCHISQWQGFHMDQYLSIDHKAHPSAQTGKTQAVQPAAPHPGRSCPAWALAL